MPIDIAQQLDDKDCMSHELAQMQDILQQYGIVNSFSFENRSTPTTWKQCIADLRFNLSNVPTSTLPTNTDTLEIYFSAEIEGRYFDKDNPNTLSDPLICLTSFNIVIYGLDRNGKALWATWHLDRHTDELNGGTVDDRGYMHPEYHITFGGKKMEEDEPLNFGNILILPTPRLPHPPMDVVLGIDFIIQNFYPKEHKIDILEDERYIAIVKNAQLRLWRPYFRSLASHWQSNLCTVNTDNFSPMRLLSCLITPNPQFA